MSIDGLIQATIYVQPLFSHFFEETRQLPWPMICIIGRGNNSACVCPHQADLREAVALLLDALPKISMEESVDIRKYLGASQPASLSKVLETQWLPTLRSLTSDDQNEGFVKAHSRLCAFCCLQVRLLKLALVAHLMFIFVSACITATTNAQEASVVSERLVLIVRNFAIPTEML